MLGPGLISRWKEKLVVSTLSLSAMGSAAFAHAPLTLTFGAHKILHFLPSNAVATRSPGVSGATQAYRTLFSGITREGYNNGLNQSLAQAFQGQIASGQLTGTFSQQISGSTYLAFNNFSISLNQLGGSAPAPVNSILFSNPAHMPGTDTHSTFALASHRLPPSLSGSQRAAETQLHLAAENSTSAGIKAGNTLASSPIVAGEFYGSAYATANSTAPFTYSGTYKFAYGFGTDPLNGFSGVTQFNISSYTLRNYIQLANGDVFTYSSGLLSGSTFYSGTQVGQRLLSIGNDPYNFFNSNSPAGSFSAVLAKFPLSYLTK